MPEGGVPRWVVLTGVLTLAFCFTVAYRSGAAAQQRETSVPLSTLRHQLEDLSSRTNQCGLQYTKASKRALRGRNASLVAALDAANATHSDLAAQEQTSQEAVSRCNAALDTQRSEIADKKQGALARATQLAVLNARLDSLSKSIVRARSGLGMQRALLLEALHTHRRKHMQLLRKAGEAMPFNTSEYEAELIDQYARNESTTPIKEEAVAAEVISGDKDFHDIKVAKFIKRWRDFRYDPAAHPDIYIPAQDAPTTNQTMAAPRYFGRDPPEEETVGLALAPVDAPVRTTAFQIQSVVSVALCAYKHNNSNLSFPSKFRRVSDQSSTEFLNETLRTPLLTFCSRCTSALRSALFRMTCGKESPRRIYGGYPFWAARSMVRPTQAVIDAARDKYSALGLAGRKVLAVAFKNPPQLQEKCAQSRAPQLHYMWARAVTAGNASATLFEAVNGTNRTEQCQPTRATLFDALETLRQRFKFDAMLVSVESSDDEQFIQGSSFGGAAQVVAFRPKTAFEDMVDIVIASWADHVLLNRFSDHSQVVAEGFALRNNIDPSNRMHFF